MDSDITAVRVGATGPATTARTRVRGVFMATTAIGSIELRNGVVGGALGLMLDAAGAGSADVMIPGNGILFPNGVFVVMTGGISGVTLLCG